MPYCFNVSLQVGREREEAGGATAPEIWTLKIVGIGRIKWHSRSQVQLEAFVFVIRDLVSNNG